MKQFNIQTKNIINKKRLFWLFFFMTISLSRVVLKKHFPIDIIAWVVFGAICIIIVMVNTDSILWVMDVLIQHIMLYLQ